MAILIIFPKRGHYSTVVRFPLESGQEDEDSTTKVSWLSWIALELKKQVEEFQSRQVPSTPPEVLEECNKVASEDVAKICDR